MQRLAEMRLGRLVTLLAVAAGCHGQASPDRSGDDDGASEVDARVDEQGAPGDAAVADAVGAGDGGITDAGDGCAVVPTGDWTGTARIYGEGAGSSEEVTAQVHWTRVETSACVDHYRPSGRVEYTVSANCNVVYDPPSAAIALEDGELVIDRTAAPATYRVVGSTVWPASETCAESDTPPFPTTAGGDWVDADGFFDGRVIAGEVNVEHDSPRILAWDFRRDDATFEPPTGGCAEAATDQGAGDGHRSLQGVQRRLRPHRRRRVHPPGRPGPARRGARRDRRDLPLRRRGVRRDPRGGAPR